MSKLEGGVAAMAVSSGQAASTFSIQNICHSGDNFVSSTDLYGGTWNLFNNTMKEMGIEHDEINVNGGAIAMGHPLGATGGMVLGTLIDEIERRDLSTGLVNLCIGGGMGTSTIIERV